MSILRSLNTGASGLRAHGEAIAVTGDNITNVNSIGFKRQRANFEDILGKSIAGSENIQMAGAGVRMGSIQTMFTQGALLTTDSPTDLAISGDGFFTVNGTVQGTTGNFYTRAGQFHINNEGILVNEQRLELQGYTADENGVMGSTLGNLTVAGQTIPAHATENIAVAVNLDANSAVLPAGTGPDTTTGGFDPDDPDATANFSTSLTVYDSVGNSHDITMYFRKTATGSWEYNAVADATELTSTPRIGAQGTLTFDTSGRLTGSTPTAGMDFDFVDAAPGQALTLDFGTLYDAATDTGGLDGATQFAGPSTTNGLSQDGFSAGTVSGISVASDGQVTGVFSNGQRRTLGQVALADFTSVEGLSRAGQGLYVETIASGEALIGAPEASGRGSVVSGALESSNVDIGQEFINLIAYQRGFQASSRVVTTADELYNETVNIKR